MYVKLYNRGIRGQKMKKILYIAFMMLLLNINVFAASNNQPEQKYINTTSLNIVANPNKFLNKTVKIQATFDKFSTLGLDYKKALRPSTKYIGILIQRDDVVNHNIPLSEMKIFLTKELAEKHIDLDTGDKIELTGKVFSTALGDAWFDVETLNIIKKVKQSENKQ
jgi:lysyl-tRNA synthetase class II